jgi:preprotein translocase subunit SecF
VLLSAENVGPQVGADLQKKAVLAIIWSTVGMLAYIAVRFRSIPCGVGAIVALCGTLSTVGSSPSSAASSTWSSYAS